MRVVGARLGRCDDAEILNYRSVLCHDVRILSLDILQRSTTSIKICILSAWMKDGGCFDVEKQDDLITILRNHRSFW